ncbi:unnamed protein product [Albugo candida]|uniref:Major facilitator superfamily associated domain-containing protein n=1 Tax=Albugo candida TaxID=65357 RepID=A0A024G2R2_9STRA|nr:unnamed protein product [Albugo candida]|eukprot:CCI40837.1 unnamed protein product [Albugo candida]
MPFDHYKRFVAGAKFFNYEQLGALRGGGEVFLFSKNQHGLLAAAFASCSVNSMIRYCLRPSLPSTLGFHFDEPPFGPFCLVSLPTSLGVFFGLLSDSVPVGKYRRKPYMVIGAVIAALALTGLTALSTAVNANTVSSKYTAAHLLYVYMTLIPICIAGIVLLKVATEARIIELSQREPLRTRGTILINYLLFRTIIECVCACFTAIVLKYDASTGDFFPRIHSTWIYGTLCIICLAVIPLIIYQAEEDAVHGTNCDNRLSDVDLINIRGQQTQRFFRMCHQRAVWQVALFLAFAMATLQFDFSSATKFIARLVDPEPSTEIYILTGRVVIYLMVMLAWKTWWLNSSWRRFALCGFLFAAAIDLIRNLLVLHVRAMRNEIFYYSIQLLTGISGGILYTFALVPAVELAEDGLEGATSGPFASFCCNISTIMRTICRKMSSDVSWLNSESPNTISQVTLAVCTLALINGLSAVAVPLLPHQKLDAQQLRAFGGYTDIAPFVLFFAFFAMFFLALGLGIDDIAGLVRGGTG